LHYFNRSGQIIDQSKGKTYVILDSQAANNALSKIRLKKLIASRKFNFSQPSFKKFVYTLMAIIKDIFLYKTFKVIRKHLSWPLVFEVILKVDWDKLNFEKAIDLQRVNLLFQIMDHLDKDNGCIHAEILRDLDDTTFIIADSDNLPFPNFLESFGLILQSATVVKAFTTLFNQVIYNNNKYKNVKLQYSQCLKELATRLPKILYLGELEKDQGRETV
jgi:hypothetical protein